MSGPNYYAPTFASPSESAAWAEVQRFAEMVRRMAADEMPLDRKTLKYHATNVENGARNFYHAAKGGRHTNPALAIMNPLPGGKLRADEKMSDRVYELAYKHVEDGRDYKHDFAAGVQLWSVTMGEVRAALLVGKNGQPLWKDF